MKDLFDVEVLVASLGPDGKSRFIEAGDPARFVAPEIIEVAFVWALDAVPSLPGEIGAAPADLSMPKAGGTKFGIVCYAARSAGKFDPVQRNVIGHEVHEDGMHKTDTVDYDLVISGKIDVVLDSGEVRTLRPGSLLVMAGANHAWQNPYDEPCIFAAVNVGAKSGGAG